MVLEVSIPLMRHWDTLRIFVAPLELVPPFRDRDDFAGEVRRDQQRGGGGGQLRRAAEPEDVAPRGEEHGRVLRRLQGREGHEVLQTQRGHQESRQRWAGEHNNIVIV